MKRSLISILMLASATALLLAGCASPIGGVGDGTGTGLAMVQLTDAPAAEADSLLVHFGRIDLVPAEDGADGIVTVTTEGGEVEVLSLRNGGLAELGEVELPAGTYHQLRLIVEDASISFEGGAEVFPVTIPSGAETGIKINIEPPLVVSDGAMSTVTIDFDVQNGVIETPAGSQQYKLKPTAIRATTTSSVLTGVVTDLLGAPIADATVEVSEAGGAVVTSTITEADGSFKIITLPAGSYDVNVSATGYVSLGQTGVTLTADQTTDLGVLSLTLVAPAEPAAP